MFDTARKIDLTIPSPEGDKKVTVRFPTDEELAERSRKTKLVTRQIGRGKSTTEPQANEKNDAELFAKIKESGDELDEYEASQVIGRLIRCEVTDSVREGNHFVITLKVPGAKTIHTVKVPSAKQQQNHTRQAISVVDGRHGVQELKLNIAASGDLYDALMVKTEGYAAGVPLPHKSVVISEIFSLINQDTDDSDLSGF